MKAFFIQLGVQFRGDLRDKGILMVYYLVPLAFYLVMGSIMKALEMETGAPLTLSITVFAMSMSAYLGMPQSLVKAREQGVLEAYRAAGIPAWSMPIATIVISTLHILVVAVIILATAPLLFGAAMPEHMGRYTLTVLLCALCSEALGALLACLVKKQSTLTLAGQCLFLPTVMLSGIMFPAALLPKAMQLAGEALPATQTIKLYTGSSVWPLVVLAAVTLGAVAAAVVLFRRISMRA